MYYYYHAATGTSQWDYPTMMQQPLTVQPLQPAYTDYQYQTPLMALPSTEIQLMSTDSDQSEIERSGYATPPQPPPETTSAQITLSATAASLVSPAHGFSRDPIPDKSAKRKRAVPQDIEKPSTDPYRDPYRSSKKKRDQGDSNSDDGLLGSATESGTSSPLPTSVIASGPVLRETAPEPPQDVSLQYQSMTPPPPPPAVETIESIAMSSPRPDTTQLAKTKVKKKKKSEGLAPLKKLKHVSSLVQKWQTVKQQAEDEENVEEESDDDFEVASEKRINEWKKEMENSDARNFNPNFQEIKGDWRERLKRKTAT